MNGHSAQVLSRAAVSIRHGKRVLDLVLVLAVLPILLPVMAVIAIGIWLVSPGPVLFRQERVGFRGRRFDCFKFRTMAVDADSGVHAGHLERLLESNAPMVKMDAKGDPRVIPLGALLRSSGLDELPQVINVLLGDMSLVGPRPCLPYEFEKYQPWQRERFNALPGLTGLWQVSGKNRTTFVEMVQFDIRYARQQSLWLDLKIILKTIPALLGQMKDDWTRKNPPAKLRQPGVVVFVREAGPCTVSKTATAEPPPAFEPGCLTRKGT